MLKRRPNFVSIAFGIFWLAYTFILAYGMLQVSRYTPVPGSLVSAYANYRTTSATSRSPSWVVDVSYTYSFKGRAYEGSALRIGGNGMMTESFATQKAAAMTAGSRNITVWVDPSNPNRAVIDRSISLQAWLFWGLLIALMWLSQQLPAWFKSPNPVLFKPTFSGDRTRSADVIEQANVLLAYGRTAQAISLLEDALQAHPERRDIKDRLDSIKTNC